MTRTYSLGERIRYFRVARGMTFRVLADRCGRQPPYLHALENGQRSNPTLETIVNIAVALQVPVGALIGESELDCAFEPGQLPGAETILPQFFDYVLALPPVRQLELRAASKYERATMLVDWLLKERRYTEQEVAQGIRVHVRTLNDFQYGAWYLRDLPLLLLAGLTRIPWPFFEHGLVPTEHTGGGE